MTLELISQDGDNFEQWRQKDNLAIAKINDHTEQIGSLENLSTINNSSVVSAINEVNNKIQEVNDVVTVIVLNNVSGGGGSPSGTDLTGLIIALG